MEPLSLLFLAILVFAAGYVAGWVGHAKALISRILEDPDTLLKLISDYKKQIPNTVGLDPNVREIKVEHVKGIFFLYAKDNGQFLAQGETLDLALEKAYKRFPHQVFQGVVSSEEAKRMGLSN